MYEIPIFPKIITSIKLTEKYHLTFKSFNVYYKVMQYFYIFILRYLSSWL